MSGFDPKATAILTGAGGGIGRATAVLFAQEGVNLVLSDRNADALEETAKAVSEAGGQAVTLAGDVNDADHRSDIVAAAIKQFGRIDALVNNAGMMAGGLPEDIDAAQWDACFDVNVRSQFFLTQEALSLLEADGGGSVVNISSVLGLLGVRNGAPYGASKAAVVGLTQSLALDLGERGVRVNAVCPGTIDTQMPREYMAKNLTPEQQKQGDAAVLGRHIIQRMGRPEEVAEAIVFLASSRSSFITGVALPVDGGWAAW
jgi:2-keto-3-deoxy-L-fuconate dehydrogenase